MLHINLWRLYTEGPKGPPRPVGVVVQLFSLEMVDPVIISNGQTYERHAIQRWFSTRDTDPATNAKPMPVLTLCVPQ